MKPDGLIISPGPKGPADAWQSLSIVREFGDTMPILGICLGMEILAYAAGASVTRGRKRCTASDGHSSRRPGLIQRPSQNLFRDPLPFTGRPKNSLPPTYRVDAISDDGAVMAYRTKSGPSLVSSFTPKPCSPNTART